MWIRQIVVLLILALVAALFLGWLLPALGWLAAWLISITGVTFFTYGYDKAIAGSGRNRVAERTLLILVLVGGTLGALIGMSLFRHKTRKRSFQIKLVLVLLVQVFLVFVYYFWFR